MGSNKNPASCIIACLLVLFISCPPPISTAADEYSVTHLIDTQQNSTNILDIEVVTNFKPYMKTWKAFILKHGKMYKTKEEELERFSIFQRNVKEIEDYNSKYKTGNRSFYMGINQFTDMTEDEYMVYAGLHVNISDIHTRCTKHFPKNDMVLPKSVDWRTKGYVTKVKDQGQCGSCWTFSTTGSLEGQIYRKTKKLISLSEQQLVDCCTDANGCKGGWIDRALMYIQRAGGIESEQGYKYNGKENKCSFDKSKVVAKDSGCAYVTSGEDALQRAVAEIGPVSVYINAHLKSFAHYKGGIYDDAHCNNDKKSLDHAVLVVGYGTDQKNGDFWIVKNSWSSSWGEKGYILMSRNRNNQCGIADSPIYPIV